MLEQASGALATPKGAAGYLSQMDAVLAGLGDTLRKQQAVADAKRAARDERAAALQALLVAQRAYFRAVKELEAEAEKNDALAARAARAGGQN